MRIHNGGGVPVACNDTSFAECDDIGKVGVGDLIIVEEDTKAD